MSRIAIHQVEPREFAKQSATFPDAIGIPVIWAEAMGVWPKPMPGVKLDREMRGARLKLWAVVDE